MKSLLLLFFLDMATSGVSFGKVEVQRVKNQPIPEGWVIGEDGNIMTDANEAANTGMLLPLGGLEITSGYKGKLIFINNCLEFIYLLLIFIA